MLLITLISLIGCSSLNKKKIELKFPQYITTKVNYSKDLSEETKNQILKAEQLTETSYIYRESNIDNIFFGVSNNQELELAIYKCAELTNVLTNK